MGVHDSQTLASQTIHLHFLYNLYLISLKFEEILALKMVSLTAKPVWVVLILNILVRFYCTVIGGHISYDNPVTMLP